MVPQRNSVKLCTLSFFPLITKPTRVQSHAATLIDNIYFNNIASHNMTNGILNTDISDHFPVFSIDHHIATVTPCNSRKSRMFGQNNIQIFKDSLHNFDWSEILNNTNGREAFSLFYTKFCKLDDFSFSEKKYQNKLQKLNRMAHWRFKKINNN